MEEDATNSYRAIASHERSREGYYLEEKILYPHYLPLISLPSCQGSCFQTFPANRLWSACNVFLSGSPECHNQTYSESPVQVGEAGAAAAPGEHQGLWWPLTIMFTGTFQAPMPGR